MMMSDDGLEAAPGFGSDLPALAVQDLHVEVTTSRRVIRPVNDVSFEVNRGETMAVLGESGSGKSMTARAAMGILPQSAGRVTAGTILMHGVDLEGLAVEQRRRVRGARIAMIFQDALAALNPVLSVGYQIGEAIQCHRHVSRRELKREVVRLLGLVKVPAPERRARDYPHQLSGGMRQRVMIATALALDPEILIADEPTTGLDVTVQAQIMNLLAGLQRDNGMGLMLITHDLAVAAEAADKVAVMYAGRIIESGPVETVYQRPAHPYTQALLQCVPQWSESVGASGGIAGSPPDLALLPDGCAFRPRCSWATETCLRQPSDYEVAPNHTSTCHHWQEVVHP